MLPIQALCQLVIRSRTTLCCGSQPFFLAKSTGYFWGSFFLQLFLVCFFFFFPAVPWKRQPRTSGDALGSGHMYDDVIILCLEDRPLSFHKKQASKQFCVKQRGQAMSKNHLFSMIQILWMASVLRVPLAVPNTKIPCSSGQLNSILPPPTPHPSPSTFRGHVLRQLEIEVSAPQATTGLCAALCCPNT